MGIDPILHESVKVRADGIPERRLHLVPDLGPPKGNTQGVSSLANAKPAAKSEMIPGEAALTVLERARAGEPQAFYAIFQRYGKPVLAFLYHLLGDRTRAEELAQETFFRAFRSLDRMQDGVKLSTWIFGIARNVAREAIRDKHRTLREVGLDDSLFLTLPDGKANPAENFISEELRRAIRNAVTELSDDQRVVFVLKVLNKMRYQEISQITGASVGKLKTDLHRARQLIRQKLQPYLAGRIPGM
jgi:RNA polymerase sigma-70 factor (ECF subfamily)